MLVLCKDHEWLCNGLQSWVINERYTVELFVCDTQTNRMKVSGKLFVPFMINYGYEMFRFQTIWKDERQRTALNDVFMAVLGIVWPFIRDSL